MQVLETRDNGVPRQCGWCEWWDKQIITQHQWNKRGIFSSVGLGLSQDAIRESYGPWVYSQHINKTFTTLLLFSCFLSYYLQLATRLTCLQITKTRGLTTLLPMLGASCLFFYVQPLKMVVVDIHIGSINLGIISEGNNYPLCVAITRSSSQKTQRRSWVSGRISGAVAGEYHHHLPSNSTQNFIHLFLFLFAGIFSLSHKKYKNNYLCFLLT